MPFVRPKIVKPVKLTLPPLHDRQREFVDDPARFVVAACGSKALGLDEPIPTPNGWTTMGEVRVGDLVFDETGSPTEVTYVSPIFENTKCYRVVFGDGTEVVADGDHRWYVQRFRSGSRTLRLLGVKPGLTMTTSELLRAGLYKRPNAKCKGYVWQVAGCGPVNYGPDKDLPLDPYLLGLWLGDGNSSGAGYASADYELVEAFRRQGWLVEHKDRYGYLVRGKEDVPGKRNNFSRTLRAMGVIGKKHIPESYMRSGIDQRIALLQGLMDTDGFCSRTRDNSGASAIFYNTNETLARQVKELAESLGCVARLSTREARFNGSNVSPRGKSYGTCFVCTIKAPFQLFRLQRKAVRYTPKAVHRPIVAIEPVVSRPVKCIKVAAKSSQFLCRNFVPTLNTGKTFGLANWIIREAWNTEQGLFWWCAPVYKQAQIAFKLIGTLLPPERVHKRSSAGEMVYELLYSNGKVRSIIDFRSAERPESLRGDGVHGAVIDEAGYWKRDSHVSVLTTLTRTRGKLRIISTPKGKNWFYEEWTKGWCFRCKLSNKKCQCKDNKHVNPEYSSHQLPTSANPIIRPQEIETLKKNFTDRQFRQEILAEFLDDGAGVFSGIRACQRAKLQYEPKPGKRYVIGIDWAKQEDYTVFVVMDVDLKRVVHIERHQGLDWNVNIDRAIRCAKRWNRASMILDSTGLGDVIFDQVAAVYPYVEAFSIYNNDPKTKLIQRLQLAIERREIQLPITSQPNLDVDPYTANEDPEGRLAELGNLMDGELQMYNVSVTPTGKFQYSAPEGYRDDMVIALALAVWKISEEPMLYVFDSVSGV